MGTPRAGRTGWRGAELTVVTVPTRLAARQIAALRGKHRASVLLASIPGQVIGLRFSAAGWSAWREPEAQDVSVPPGDGDLKVGEACVDEDGVVAAQVQRAGDAGVVDVQDAGGVREVSPDPVGGGGLVPVELEREQPVKVPGDDGERGVQVDVEGDAAG